MSKHDDKRKFLAEDGPRKNRRGRHGWQGVFNAWDIVGKLRAKRKAKKHKKNL